MTMGDDEPEPGVRVVSVVNVTAVDECPETPGTV
jgi:hypothetical protein